MSKSVEAIVEPEILVWARKSIGYDVNVAAKKIGIATSVLKSWESGENRPTIKQLLKIAEVYKRPFSVFYLSVPPTELDEPFDALRDWRKLPDVELQQRSPGLTLELRQSLERRDVVIELANELGDEIGDFAPQANLNGPPESAAHRIRILLGISYDQQASWRDSYAAYNSWKKAVESLGVLVNQTGFYTHYSVGLEEMRGVAIYFSILPIILINSKDTPNARIFSLMHELCHILLRVSGIVNSYYDYRIQDPNDKKIEVYCNSFAGELLVPSENLQRELLVRGNKGESYWEESTLEELSRRYSVSKEVILRRLLAAQLTSQDFYRAKREQWQEEWTAYLKKKRKEKGGPLYHTKFVRCHGIRFVSTVFEAYQRGIINVSDVSTYLGTKTRHLDNIQRDLVRSL